MNIKNIDKEVILSIIIVIDSIILCLPFDFRLIILDFIFSSILLIDILFYDIKTKKYTKIVYIFACIPYDLIYLITPPYVNLSFFKVLRWFRIIQKIIDLIINKVYPQFKSELMVKELNKEKFIPYIVLALIMCIFFISSFEKIGFLDSIYFVIVSFASIGYGDIVMHHPIGRIITIVIAILSIIGIGLISSTFIDYLSIKNNKIDNLEKEINELKKDNKIIIDLLKNKKE